MNKLLTIIIFFVFMVSFSWGDDELCQIVDINGSVVYTGVCRYSGKDINTNGKISLNGVYVLKSTKSGASHLIRVNDNEIKILNTISSDSLSIMKNRGVNANFTSKVLKKESLISNEFYLRTNFYAINGVGYEDRASADGNFATLIAYVENELSQKFPEDTITTELVFNKTSQDIYTDFIQSIYNLIQEAGPDISVLGGMGYDMGILLYATYEDLKIRFPSLFNNPVLEEFVKYREELRNKILESNENTDATLKSELANCADNKMRALVLGHSQGGMYTYNAFNSFPDSIRTHFYSFNVAVPTANNPNWYLINDDDLVVNAARLLHEGIPVGESNGPVSGDECECNNFTHHAWNESYYKSCLRSYAKINAAIEDAFRTVPYWEKRKSARYHLVWYNGAAETTIEIAKADGSFETLGTYQGYDVTDPTVMNVPNVLLLDGVPLLRVTSYHRGSWWGPYLSNEPGFFKIISNDDGSLTYLMSDAWSQGSYDDAEFSITIIVE